MLLPRMTTRRWMIAVAIVAVLSLPVCGLSLEWIDNVPIRGDWQRSIPRFSGVSVRIMEASAAHGRFGIVVVWLDLIHAAACLCGICWIGWIADRKVNEWRSKHRRPLAPMSLTFDGLHFLDLPYRRGHCRIRVFSAPDRAAVVIATELPEDRGKSIVYACEELAWDVCQRFGIDPEQLRWVDHHPRFRGGGFGWLGFGRPVERRFVECWWRPTTQAEVEAVIGQRLAD